MRHQWCFRYESKKLTQDSLLTSGESSATSISGVTSPDDIDSPVPESDITNAEDEKEKQEHLEKKNNGRGCRPYYEGTIK